MRLFTLQRDEDEGGVSGTGKVGEVAEFPNGKAVLQWSADTLAGVPSMSIFESLQDLEKVHGHGGKTRLIECGQEGADKPELLTRERLDSMFAEFAEHLEEVHTFTLENHGPTGRLGRSRHRADQGRHPGTRQDV